MPDPTRLTGRTTLLASTTRVLPPPPVVPVHRWLLCPLQVHRMTGVPLAVFAWSTSRHRPDWTPLMEPSEFRCHFWLAWPLHDQMITWVPGEVWLL